MKWLQIGIGAAAGFALAWLIHLVILAGVNEAHQAALKEQKTSLEEKCKADQAITKGANDALQQKYNSVNSKLAALKRVQPARCVVPVTGRADAAAGGGGYAGQNGISTDWLRDYAAECETYRGQRIALEQFIDDERRGQ